MDKKCFVIMPFSKTTEKHDEKYWNDFFEIIKDLMEEIGYECTRSETGPYNLMKNILKNINSSDIVIAVLTDYNANVWYELGIRHTIKTGTIMLLQEDQHPPFDVGGFGIIFYEDSIRLNLNIKKAIKRYLDKYKDDTCDSPVIDLLGHVADYDILIGQLLDRIINEFRNRTTSTGEHDVTGLSRNGAKQSRILWVDDYPINNELVMKFLGSKNVSFDIAISTEIGIDYFKRNKYDIIITDMGRGMERDAGIRLIKELKALDCKTPIIVYTSQNAIYKYGRQASELGAYDVINGTAKIIATLSVMLGL